MCDQSLSNQSARARQSALARLRELCHDVDKLIRLVPHVLPFIDRPPATPVTIAFPTDYDRRIIVDELLSRIAITGAEWDIMFRLLPEHSCELRLLATALNELRERFKEEDRLHQEELDALAQAEEDARSRGVQSRRSRWLLKPERRIYSAELNCIESYLSLVREAFELKGSGGATASASATRDSTTTETIETSRQTPPPQEDEQTQTTAAGNSMSPAARALHAALELKREGKSVSLRAACMRAVVDRVNLRRKYPDIAEVIKKMGTPDRKPRPGLIDRRHNDDNRQIGGLDAVDDSKGPDQLAEEKDELESQLLHLQADPGYQEKIEREFLAGATRVERRDYSRLSRDKKKSTLAAWKATGDR
jgi:hypothetical protein